MSLCSLCKRNANIVVKTSLVSIPKELKKVANFVRENNPGWGKRLTVCPECFEEYREHFSISLVLKKKGE